MITCIEPFLPREDGFYRLTGFRPGTDPYCYTAFIVDGGILTCWSSPYCNWGWASGWSVDDVERLICPVRLTWEKLDKWPSTLRDKPTGAWAATIQAFVAGLPSRDVVFLGCDDPDWEESQYGGPSGRPFVVDMLPFDRETGTVFPAAQFRNQEFRDRRHWTKMMEIAGIRFVDVSEAMLAVCKKRG